MLASLCFCIDKAKKIFSFFLAHLYNLFSFEESRAKIFACPLTHTHTTQHTYKYTHISLPVLVLCLNL